VSQQPPTFVADECYPSGRGAQITRFEVLRTRAARLNAAAGPCIDCFRTGTAVSVREISESDQWPEFRFASVSQGFHPVLATPMKLPGKILGTMNLFGTGSGGVSARDAAVAQALADAATIGILQERVIRDGHVMEEQLHRALDSRIMIEQAKGIIANELSLSMDDAFNPLRKYARGRNLTIRSVSEQVSGREIIVRQVAGVSQR
jgi:GAF domain-containing protein